MTFNFTAFSIIPLLLAAIAAYLACQVYSRRSAPGAQPFTIFIIFVCIWIILRLLQTASEIYATKFVLAVAMYLSIASAAIFWLAFTIDHAGKNTWKNPRYFIVLYLLPVISVVVLATYRWHGINWVHITPTYDQAGLLLLWPRGFFFWIQMVYLLSLIAAGNFILWRTILKNPGVLRKQIIVLFIGVLIPIAAIALFSVGLGYYKGLDIIPFALIFGIAVFSLTFFRYRFLDVVPVARGALMESLPDAVIVLDNQSTVVDFNPTAQKVLDTPRKLAIGFKLARVWPQLDLHSRTLDENKHTEIAINNSYLDMSLTSFRDGKGTIVGHLLVLRDISERRRMEQSVKDSEVRYSTLVEQSNELVLITQKGLISFANAKVSSTLGYERSDILRKPLEYIVSDIDKDMVFKRHENRQAHKAEPKIYEILVNCKNGEKRSVEVSIGSIFFEGQPADMVTLRDITEKKLTQRKLEELYQSEKVLSRNLQEEMEKRSKYTRALVHELNTPLTSIMASGELLESAVEDRTLAALVKNIRRASFNLKQRIDELIELARGEVGMLKINAMPLDIGKVIEEIVSEMSPLANSKGLKMELEMGEGIGLVLGDRGRLRQVMSNLLSNAIKFTQKGKIMVSVGKYADKIEVRITDTGRGIGGEELENLFDPYHRKVNEGQELGGLGIGLALSKMFLDLHKGNIYAESRRGEGSTFVFSLPEYTAPAQ